MPNNFYITTTLPYVNAKPHIGHALEFIQADTISRRQRQNKKDVLFNIGTDEHGLKIFEKAQENNLTPQEFVDQNVETFKTFCKQFDVSYDNFYRTSDASHTKVAQDLRKKCNENEDIYEKEYAGQYCIGCESFKTAKDLVDGKCPDHNKKPINYNETNYFFRLSKHKEALLKHITTTHFVQPTHKANELKNFVEDLQDISISRKKENLPRGVPVPNDDAQVMYVRFDALSNYIGAAGYPDDMQKVEEFRGTAEEPNAVQICGPDNLRFQGAIRQGMLASAGLPPTQKLLVHGMILGPDGNKMSKTLGNTIDPMDQYNNFGKDAVRYYLIAGIPTFGDAAYKEDELINLYNSHLANTFGNLLNRVIHLANKKELNLNNNTINNSTEITDALASYQQKITDAYNNFELFTAAGQTHNLALFANEYISRPGKEPRNKDLSLEDCHQILVDCATMLQLIIHSYAPIIPHKAGEAQNMLNTQTKGILFDKIEKVEKHEKENNSQTQTKKILPTVIISKDLQEEGIFGYVGFITNAKISNKNSKAQQMKKDVVAYNAQHGLSKEIINEYKSFYQSDEKTGAESLQAIAQKNGKLPNINSAVDLYNCYSLQTSLSIGLHDLDQTQGDIIFRHTNASDNYTPLGAKEKITILDGEYGCCDQEKIICRYESRQCDQTKTSKKSKNIMIYIQGNKQADKAQAEQTFKKLYADLLEVTKGEEHTVINI